MAISVAVPIDQKTADALTAKLEPKVRAIKVEPSANLKAEMAPLVAKQHFEKVNAYVDACEAEASSSCRAMKMGISSEVRSSTT